MASSRPSSPSSDVFSQALLLRRVAYGDADWITDWLLKDGGKITLFAKNARMSRKRFPGGLEPFAVYRLAYRPSRSGGMSNLKEGAPDHRWEAIPHDLHRLSAASHFLASVAALVHEDDGDPALFTFMTRFFGWINDEAGGAFRIEAGTQRAQLRLLFSSGFLPSLAECADTGTSLAELNRAWLVPELGLTTHRPSGGTFSDAHALDRPAIEYLIELLSGTFPLEDAPDARRRVRLAINEVMRHLHGHELKTWGFYRSTFDPGG